MTTLQAKPPPAEAPAQWGPRWFTHLGRGRNGSDYDTAVRFPQCDSRHTGCSHRVMALPVTSGLMDHLRFAPVGRVAGGIEPPPEPVDLRYYRADDEHRTREAIKRARKAADDFVWEQDARSRDRAERRQPPKPITRQPQPTPVCRVSSCNFISTKEVAGTGGLRYCAPHASWMDSAVQRVHREREAAAHLEQMEIFRNRRQEEKRKELEELAHARATARDVLTTQRRDAAMARNRASMAAARRGPDEIVQRDRIKRANYLLAHPGETLPPVITCALTGCESKAIMTAGNVIEGEYCTRHGMLLNDTLAQVSWHRGGQR